MQHPSTTTTTKQFHEFLFSFFLLPFHVSLSFAVRPYSSLSISFFLLFALPVFHLSPSPFPSLSPPPLSLTSTFFLSLYYLYIYFLSPRLFFPHLHLFPFHSPFLPFSPTTLSLCIFPPYFFSPLPSLQLPSSFFQSIFHLSLIPLSPFLSLSRFLSLPI